MNTALVKIDVAAADLGVAVRRIEQMFEGVDARMGSLVWVFDFAKVPRQSARREPRFWRPELLAVAGGDGALLGKYRGYELDWVIDKILPVNRTSFHAGEVDQLFQIRHNTRSCFADLTGMLNDRRNFYPRAMLVEFLKRRWFGAVYDRSTSCRAQYSPRGRAKMRRLREEVVRPGGCEMEARMQAPELETRGANLSSPRAATVKETDNHEPIGATGTGSNGAN